MRKLVKNYSNFINEVKIAPKNKVSKIMYSDLRNLASYKELEKFGVSLDPDEPAVFRANGSLVLYLNKYAIIAENPELKRLLNDDDSNHAAMIVISHEGSILILGSLTKDKSIKMIGERLNSIESYSKNFDLVKLKLLSIQRSNPNAFRFLEDISVDSIQSNKVKTIMDDHLDSLW